MKENASRYTLVCQRCGWSTRRDPYIIHCPQCGDRAFLRAVYDKKELELCGPQSAFSSYRQWLPCEFVFEQERQGIGCVRGGGLGHHLGLENLWILLSCYAPEYGGTLPSATFKSLEAAGVMMRVLSQTDLTLIISSAGNAGCAVLEFGAQYQLPAVVVIPENARDDMWVSADPGNNSPMLICLKHATYPDAIQFVGQLQARFTDRLVREGGAYNVARRDAMGVPVLRALQEIGRIPDHYLQAVGSGTGGIAAYEAVDRLVGSGDFSPGTMRLHLAQNAPFTPMVDAWKSGRREVEVMGSEETYQRLQQTYSKVLANANPPYGVVGGVYDCLQDTGGDMVAVANEEAISAQADMERFFDFKPSPETAVALAALKKQIQSGVIAQDDTVLLHATGGGAERAAQDLDKKPYPVAQTLDPDEVDKAAHAVAAYLDRSRRRSEELST